MFAEQQVAEALGQSEAFLDFQDRLSCVAPVNRPVVLMGERGSGKELAASRLHFLSKRWEQPFVTLNCATLSPTLIEAELFGHEKGAFTGAEERRVGRFEAAQGGTLFLDEIGMIPMQAQEKILRVVEYGSFERVGSSTPVEVDVRIVGATNADLPALAAQGEFKRDLLDRLSFEVLYLPPLRSRKGDVELLARHFAARMAFELDLEEVPQFSRKAMSSLERYGWPGNIRELKNVVERAVYQAPGPVMDAVVFNPFVSPYPSAAPEVGAAEPKRALETASIPEIELPSGGGFKAAIRQAEVQLVQRALEATRFNQRQAAARLELTYDQFRGLIRKHQQALGL